MMLELLSTFSARQLPFQADFDENSDLLVMFTFIDLLQIWPNSAVCLDEASCWRSHSSQSRENHPIAAFARGQR